MEKEADAIPDCLYYSYLRDLLVVASGAALQGFFVFEYEFKQQISEQFVFYYLITLVSHREKYH